MACKCISKLARSRPPSLSPNSLDYGLQVHLQTRSITASKCISKLAQLRPPSLLDHGLQVYLQTRTIMASKSISKLTLLRPPSSLDHGLQVSLQTRSITASKSISKLALIRPPSLHDHGLQVHLQTRTIMASECISKFTRSRCGEMVELERRQPIINIPPHLTWRLKAILEKEWFWLEERRNRVRGYDRIPGHDEPHKLRGSMKAREECVRARAGKDRVCISYNVMMSI